MADTSIEEISNISLYMFIFVAPIAGKSLVVSIYCLCHRARQNLQQTVSTLAVAGMNRLLSAYIKANDVSGLCVLAIGTRGRCIK